MGTSDRLLLLSNPSYTLILILSHNVTRSSTQGAAAEMRSSEREDEAEMRYCFRLKLGSRFPEIEDLLKAALSALSMQ